MGIYMGVLNKKSNPRREKVRKTKAAERIGVWKQLANTDVIISAMLWLVFVAAATVVLSFDFITGSLYRQMLPVVVLTILISVAAALYVYHYQERILRKHTRAAAIIGLFILLLAITKSGWMLSGQHSWATGTAVTAAIILTIAYDQRFALGMSIFYCLFAILAVNEINNLGLFFTMSAGVIACVFSLREVRTRMKLLEVGALAAIVVFITSLAVEIMANNLPWKDVFRTAGLHSGAALLAGLIIQSLLPLIEKIFHIATSMTLLDYSDANQPLLKRLAMEAPGTYSHSLLVGSISETAAESIGCNGLLCRVGAYYHDIGKINKPGYFAENEMGLDSRHKELSPAMSRLIIVGHVKDGIEIAKEYGLLPVLHQFIETHHGTTLVEYFYNEARKKQDKNHSQPSESEFKYSGPTPKTKESAIVMLADAAESSVRSLTEITPTKVEAVVHNIAMKRLREGQFDRCELTLRELSRIEQSISKSLATHYHGRIAYPKRPDVADMDKSQELKTKLPEQPPTESKKQQVITSENSDK